MSLFNKYNQRDIQDRQIDTLIGLSKGLIADGKIVQAEVEFLLSWLVQNQHSEHPIIINLLNRVTEVLEDGVVDPDEAQELLCLLKSLSGESGEVGEMAKTTSLPIDQPAPKINFQDSVFLCTGTFAFGKRKDCDTAIENLGGKIAKSVNKSLNYLVLGTYVSESWAHESYGRKIEKAMAYKADGQNLVIISEEHWLRESGL
ncbi:BRCT domain-containing protein [Vibrio parahaemolyticus]|nr:NAD-dependent DNA ligase [Vibrio parahaemolyticus]MBM4910080.1 BRCT domain-containing protein [Vibrio parahaemolyticus]MBM5096393.1 BRCT domain-containing protein [Vibrio parahaemolyticus]MBM5419124.1 BRCT domain-containing protein [Vibrio parahaemolyticus]MCF9098773.1 BRCT domain-containing protein [Vibrio parahaemolyticus]